MYSSDYGQNSKFRPSPFPSFLNVGGGPSRAFQEEKDSIRQTRPRSSSDPTYQSLYPDARANGAYKVTQIAPSTKQNFGVQSKNAMAIRMILESTMMGIKSRASETLRYCNDLQKAAASGTGEALQQQFIECFPELVAHIFGMPRAKCDDKSWLRGPQVLDAEATWQLLQAKSSFFRLLVQLHDAPNTPLFPFPTALLPRTGQDLIHNSDRRLSMGMNASFSALGARDGQATALYAYLLNRPSIGNSAECAGILFVCICLVRHWAGHRERSSEKRVPLRCFRAQDHVQRALHFVAPAVLLVSA